MNRAVWAINEVSPAKDSRPRPKGWGFSSSGGLGGEGFNVGLSPARVSPEPHRLRQSAMLHLTPDGRDANGQTCGYILHREIFTVRVNRSGESSGLIAHSGLLGLYCLKLPQTAAKGKMARTIRGSSFNQRFCNVKHRGLAEVDRRAQFGQSLRLQFSDCCFAWNENVFDLHIKSGEHLHRDSPEKPARSATICSSSLGRLSLCADHVDFCQRFSDPVCRFIECAAAFRLAGFVFKQFRPA